MASNKSKIDIKNIKLAQVNLQNSKSATSSLIQYLYENNYKIGCLQDCYLYNNRPVGLPDNTTCYSSTNKNAHIIIIDDNIQHIQVMKNNNSVFINIESTIGNITIGSQYSPPSSNIIEDLSDWLHIKGGSSKKLILGDMNGHSPLWGYENEDDRGLHIINHMANCHLIVLNDPYCLPTFERDHLRGWPDISLCSMNFFEYIKTWEVESDMLYGDHRLITITLDITINKLQKRRYRTKNVPFTNFNKMINDGIIRENLSFNNIRTIDDFDSEYDDFRKVIIQACDKNFKKKNQSYTPSIRWWTKELSRQRSYLKALYRKSKLTIATIADKLKYKKERAKYKIAIAKARQDSWENFCRNSIDPYGKIKDLGFRNYHRVETFAINPQDTVESTKEDYYSFLTTTIFGASTYTCNFITDNPLQVPPITKQELKEAIYSFNANKSPGIDNIDHNIIRNIHSHHNQLLLNMYNSLFCINYFPIDWKIGELVFFLKKGRDPNNPDSYRPISLLPIFGKILEKLLLRRINHFLSNSIKIEKSQFGFVEGRSTERAITELFSLIDILKENNKYLSLISLDIHHAFDNLPWKSTIDELYYIDLHKAYINIIKSFLSKRGALPNWKYKKIHWFGRGCPQGSCLGPFLWKILLNSLLRKLRTTGFKIIAFADDLLLIIYGNTRAALELQAYEFLKLISTWMKYNNLSLSIEKSEVLHLNKPKKLKRPPIYKIDNKSISQKNTIKYLGLHLDKNLSFLPHIRKKKEEIMIIAQNLLKFASSYGGVTKHILKTWYKVILEKKIIYGSSIWYDKLPKSHGHRLLASTQYACLLLITRAYNKTSIPALNVLTGIPPIFHTIEKLSIDARVLRLGQPVSDHYPYLYQSKVLSSIVQPYKEYYNILPENKKTIVNIFTDGSKIEGQCGYAFTVYYKQYQIFTHQRKLSKQNSIYQAELMAITDAISWIDTSNFDEATIHSDNYSGIQAINKIFTTNHTIVTIILQLQATNKQIYLNWVKAHVGLLGNEEADKLAKEAALSEKIKLIFYPFPQSYLKRITKQNSLQTWQTEWNHETRGRFTYTLQPKISEDQILDHRNLYLFASNHGPFPAYLNLFNKAPSAFCTCGGRGTSLHYILDCPLTIIYHIKKSRSINLAQWFQVILHCKHLKQKIIDCVKLIENNQFIFQGVQHNIN